MVNKENISEKEFQDLISKDKKIQKDICNYLNIDFNAFRIKAEDEYINGLIADFTLFENNIVKSIVECKGGNIGLTEWVRGIGQIFQYEYFAENKYSKNGYDFSNLDEFSSAYIFPDSVLRINKFNVALFKYPNSSKLIEINTKNNTVRLIDKKELEKLKESTNENLVIISQYYIRDNRIFEIYFLLKVLSILKIKNQKVDRKTLENEVLIKTNTINNGNWRNAFISLSSLGFIDKNNYPTEYGNIFANMSFEDFAYMIFTSYIYPYYNLIIAELELEPNIKNSCLLNKIKQKHSNRDVLFLTESNSRYISSWLNIARDDYGFLQFSSRSNERKILYNPLTLNEETFKKKIKEYSIYFSKYEEIFNNVIKNI